MRAVLVNASERMPAERAALGLDKLDERWEGEWHFVNPPKLWHAELSTDLLFVLVPLARACGLRPYGDATGVFAGDQDWRVPDQAYAHPEDRRDEGLASAELVVEIRSSGDETYRKLPFYAGRGVGEVLVVHEDRRFELYRLREDGEYVRFEEGDGSARSSTLDVVFSTVAGPRLRVTWAHGAAEV